MWIEVCMLEACPAGAVRTAEADGLCVAVFRLADGSLRAIEDRCPHRGARLSRGVVYDGDKVACLDHGWSVRLTDGGAEPPERGCVRMFEVKVEDGVVFVLV
jgi:nitrite reductase [NAD(P)H] small subunit